LNDKSGPERLDKILSKSGYGSRSDVKKLIRTGAVSCDGIIAKDPQVKFSPESSHIEVYGRRLNYSRFIYLMMHKPEGVISAACDPERTTVVDLLPDLHRLRKPFPAGRLDIDSTGLLLITDDGDLAHRLLSPKKHVEKEYEVVIDKSPDENIAQAFERGVVLDGKTALRPARLIKPETRGQSSSDGDTFKAGVIITEGKFHQIKRMFAAFGIRVIKLKRIRIGDLILDPELEPGESRELTENELTMLQEITAKVSD
jgi:16S rRNA pseudouridine516 synthase